MGVNTSDKLKDWARHKPKTIISDDDLWRYLTFVGEFDNKFIPQIYNEAKIYVRKRKDGERLMGISIMQSEAGIMVQVKLRLQWRTWSFIAKENLKRGDEVVIEW